MANREYNGEDINMAWSSPPWANNGETVGSTDEANANGSITTDGEIDAENLTGSDELTDEELCKEIRDIKISGGTYKDITDKTGIASKGTIADAIYGRGRFEAIEYRDKEIADVRGNTGQKPDLSEDDVRELREKLIGGELSTNQAAEHYNETQSKMYRYAIGARSVNPDNPGPLEYSNGGWVEKESPESNDGRDTKQRKSITGHNTPSTENHSDNTQIATNSDNPFQKRVKETAIAFCIGVIVHKIYRWIRN